MSTATSSSDIGTRIAKRLHESLGPRRYAMWFDRTARFELTDDEQALTVIVPNKFLADGIGRQFGEQVRQAACSELGHDVRLDLSIQPLQSPSSLTAERTLCACPAPERASQLNRTRRAARPDRWRYRLDDFVVGPSNQLAFAAATQIANLDDATGSPLFIHGGCGLGKTHLLQGICHRVSRLHPDARVHYTTGEQFTNDYIAAVRTNSLDAFRRKIRRLDLLAVDDVHFIANKEKTQQEFLHCFNEIELAGARVVMVSDCHPKLIKQFSDALASRCVRGMVVRIDQPDAETRLRLVEALAERRGLAMPQSVAQTIADRCTGSVRDIEGLLNKLQALTLLQRSSRPSVAAIGHSLLDQLFKDQPAVAPRKPVRFQNILDAVCELFALSPEQVTGRLRKRHVVIARSLLILLAYEMTGMSYPEIAAAMGRPNHSTIITAAQRIRKQLTANETMILPGFSEPVRLSSLLERLKQAIANNMS